MGKLSSVAVIVTVYGAIASDGLEETKVSVFEANVSYKKLGLNDKLRLPQYVIPS